MSIIMLNKRHNIKSIDSEENFISDINRKSQSIYLVVSFSIVLVIASLPLINVSISIQSRGIIRPVKEVAEIKVLLSARVGDVYIVEGQKVKLGDTLIKLDTEAKEFFLEFLRKEWERVNVYIHDLENLTRQSNQKLLITEVYASENRNYEEKVLIVESQIIKANKAQERNKALFENSLISVQEYEELLFGLNQLKNERSILETGQMARWRSDLVKYLSERENYAAQILQIERELDQYVIRAPVNGSVESFSGIYPGINLHSGQIIALISPTEEFIAEIYVTANKIGHLYHEMPVKMQIDAFNYNEWGILNGEICGISDDYTIINNIPMFKVKCSLEKRYLELKNGTKGNIKKGMTMNARFIVSKRTIFQLLYEKSDDWLNPSRELAVTD